MARLTRKKPKRKPKKAKVIAAPPATPPSSPSPDAGDLRSHATHKIFPRNLTAQAAYQVPGNPAITRPEDAVANCFPGLEIDVRNLDRRFFPGLVFDFVENGARLMYVDVYEDPDTRLDTPKAQNLYFLLSSDDMQSTLTDGVWFLDWIEQGGKKISMHWKGQPVADTVSWRIVRSLELGPVKICLRQRHPDDTSKLLKDGGTVTLEGWRRRFTDPETGVISSAYKPGELLQGLCSPWQHDFRDCSCFYWAANHPDIVLGEAYPGESIAAAVDESGVSNIPIDWLRADRKASQAAEALETIDKNRPHQIDHFQVNGIWQDLNIVLENREIGGLYVPQTSRTANPYSSPDELAGELRGKLAPLEIALTFEYLYARFSLISEEEAKRLNDETLYGAVLLARERLLLIAASEMQHLRWVNQMLWDLQHAGLIPNGDFTPALIPADEIPTVSTQPCDPTLIASTGPEAIPATQRPAELREAVSRFITTERTPEHSPAEAELPPAARFRMGDAHRLTETRKAELRPLAPCVLTEFIAVEHPSAYIDGAYARVIATLSQGKYPPYMVELALRIAGDGVQHENRFREIRNALSPFVIKGQYPKFLRPNFTEATPQQAAAARTSLRKIKENLRAAYIAAAQNQNVRSAENVTEARQAMNDLLKVGEDLAERGLGLPFFKLWNDIP
jgi:Ferritin-like